MNKYLKGFVKFIISCAICFVGGLFSLNILAAGFIFYPDILTRVDQVLIEYQSFSSAGAVGFLTDDGIMFFIIGFLPLFFLLVTLVLGIFFFFQTIRLTQKVDIKIDAIKKKEVKNE